MAHRFVVLVALSLAAVEAAHAGDPIRSGGNFGLGLGGGLAVSGLSGKYWLAEAHALQGVVGAWGLGRAGGSSLGVGLDYLIEMPTITDTEPVEIGWNLGVGGTLGVGGNGLAWAGASGVAGLEFNFHPVPIDLVLEYRPGVVVVPAFGAYLVNFSGHIRYYF